MYHVICYNNYLSASAYKLINGLWGELNVLPFSTVAYIDILQLLPRARMRKRGKAIVCVSVGMKITTLGNLGIWATR